MSELTAEQKLELIRIAVNTPPVDGQRMTSLADDEIGVFNGMASMASQIDTIIEAKDLSDVEEVSIPAAYDAGLATTRMMKAMGSGLFFKLAYGHKGEE
jgi:hypothetical protein